MGRPRTRAASQTKVVANPSYSNGEAEDEGSASQEKVGTNPADPNGPEAKDEGCELGSAS